MSVSERHIIQEVKIIEKIKSFVVYFRFDVSMFGGVGGGVGSREVYAGG